MIQLDRNVHILFASASVDFRKSFEGLCGIVRNDLNRDPLDKSLYVFYNRRRDRIKLLIWEDDGFWLHYKRLETGTFEIPPIKPEECQIVLDRTQLEFLLSGIVLKSVRYRKRYKPAIVC